MGKLGNFQSSTIVLILLFNLALFFKATKVSGSTYHNKNNMLCYKTTNHIIQSNNQISEILSSNSTTQTLIKLTKTTEVIMQKIETPYHLNDQYVMWLKKNSFNKPDQYFLIYKEYSSGSAEFPIVKKSVAYPNNSFAYQTGIEGYDSLNSFGRYKVIFQFKTPIQDQLILEKTLCVRPIFQ